VSDLARAIRRVVIDLAMRRGLMLGGVAQTDRVLAFEDAAEVAIDRLIEAEARAARKVEAQALVAARADVAHTMAELAKVTAERDDARAELERVAGLLADGLYVRWADHTAIVDEHQRVIDALMATVDRLQGHPYGGEGA
jgi:hypothetical protein